MARKRTSRLLAGYTPHNKVTLVHGGSDYFSCLVRMIDESRLTIHLQTYIFQQDQTGHLVAEALKRAARRKVQVFVLLDGYASQDLSRHFIRDLKSSGIRFRWFWPLLKSRHFYLGRRMHHKVVVVDASRSLTGGVNISDRYNDIDGHKAWLDWAVYVEGQAALRLHVVCKDMWQKAYWKKGAGKEQSPWLPGIIPEEECLVRVRRNDWVMAKNQISKGYLDMFRHAAERITIMSSYFLPGKIFRKQMATAARRGVRVRIIMGGVSDVTIARQAEQYMYRWLFRNGIEVYEYQETILHGKLAAYDGRWVTVGSYNVNRISAYASVELNIDVRNEKFATDVERQLDTIMQQHCVRITHDDFFSKTSLFSRLRQRLAYEIIRILFFLFTFYFKQEKGVGRRGALHHHHPPRPNRP